MYPYDDEENYGSPADLMGYQRMAQGQDRLDQGQQRIGMQGLHYAMLAAQQKQANQLKAAQLGATMGVTGARDNLYSLARGGQPGDYIPGATYHNSLIDQGRYQEERNAMQAPQPQGLYRVGSEYGFNGKPLGHLSSANPDMEFDALQAEHYAGQQSMAGAQEHDQNSMLMNAVRQHAAQQEMLRKEKARKDFFGMFKMNYGSEAGEAFSHYDPTTGIASIPTRQVMGEDEMGNKKLIDLPPRTLRIPAPLFSQYQQHVAGLAGLGSADEMTQHDPVEMKHRELAQLEQEKQAEKMVPTGAALHNKVDLSSAYSKIFGESPSEASFRNESAKQRTLAAAAKAKEDAEQKKRNEFRNFGLQVRAATGMP